MASPTQDLSSHSPQSPNYSRAGARCVLDDFKRFGPAEFLEVSDPPPLPVTLVQSLDYCRELTAKHYENFSVASRLLPQSLRQDFANIYAYCRWSDDLADETGDSERALFLLDWWEKGLVECFEGAASRHPVYLALGQSIQKHSLQITPFLDLLRAFRTDQHKVRYASDAEIEAYCSGSANPVGRILLRMARCDSRENLEWSDSICTGLQIANFCQDIRVDALRNRIYLPEERWSRSDVTEEMILDGVCTKPLQEALCDWTRLARSKLIGGFPLCRAVPLWLARDLQLFIRGGLAVLEEIGKAHYDVWSKPVEVTKRKKLLLLLRALIAPRSMAYRSTTTRPRDSKPHPN